MKWLELQTPHLSQQYPTAELSMDMQQSRPQHMQPIGTGKVATNPVENENRASLHVGPKVNIFGLLHRSPTPKMFLLSMGTRLETVALIRQQEGNHAY
jgi:hypothetical protein